MTVQELMDVMPYCNLLEIVVRKTGHGQWIQGYRIGKEAKVFPSEQTVEEWESHSFRSNDHRIIHLKKGQEIDIGKGYNLPMKVICKDCHKLPEHIGSLEVCSVQPRHIPQFHKEALTHNDFALNVNCCPDNYVPEKHISSKDVTTKAIESEQIAGQISLFDYMD